MLDIGLMIRLGSVISPEGYPDGEMTLAGLVT